MRSVINVSLKALASLHFCPSLARDIPNHAHVHPGTSTRIIADAGLTHTSIGSPALIAERSKRLRSQILSIDLASEMPPAVSLAYEQPEQDIMLTRPRSRKTRLLSKGLLVYAYLFAGTGITIGCIAAYLSVYWLVPQSRDLWLLAPPTVPKESRLLLGTTTSHSKTCCSPLNIIGKSAP